MTRQWFRLDTAGLIFPAVRSRDWANAFRVSMTLTEDIDPDILQAAVDDLKPRFPSLYVRLKTGVFWHYLEDCGTSPAVREDYAYPLTFMGIREVSRCCLRVLYYRNRIAVEYYHVLTDGTGGSIYLQTLAARYLERRFGITIPPTGQVLDFRAAPSEEELEDSFHRHTGLRASSRREADAFRLTGTKTRDGFRYLITGILPADKLLAAAHEHHCSVTVFLAAVMAEAVMGIQDERCPRRSQKPVKITIPINMRRLYNSRTLRNFVLTLNLGVDPRNGDYSLYDLCQAIRHQLAAEATPQAMAGRIAANVLPQKNPAIRLAPLFIKNAVMGMVYASTGEKKGCLNVSNLGRVTLPESMQPYVERMEFIVGVQKSYPNNCAVLTLGNRTYINMIRSIRETELERRFFSRLVELGIPVEIESNDDGRSD